MLAKDKTVFNRLYGLTIIKITILMKIIDLYIYIYTHTYTCIYIYIYKQNKLNSLSY